MKLKELLKYADTPSVLITDNNSSTMKLLGKRADLKWADFEPIREFLNYDVVMFLPNTMLGLTVRIKPEEESEGADK